MKVDLPALLTSLLLAQTCPGAEQPAGEVHNSQKETIPLLKPREALERIKLPDGFEATLFAGEPDVRQPIAMTFDARGRLWVAENYTYSEAAINFDLKQRDRILIFEDRDGNGEFDERKVFWDQGERLTSIAVGFGGVFATCPPNFIFIPDADKDDKPDGAHEVLLDGFDADKVRHTLANGLKFGPDGWLYGRHGIQATSLAGKPGSPREERTPLNGCIWRFHPTRRVFELVAQGTTNPWGSDWDEHGELFFINTVIGHLWHAAPGAYFKRMYGEPFNPHIYELIDQTADHVHWDTREAWNDINKGTSASTSAAGGGHAHTGLMMYLGDNWPAEYRNQMFTLNFHGKRINRDVLARSGAGYVGRHAPDFMSIDDPWFRGIELLYGPDGGVYVADWSDIGECHDHEGIHRGSGRIYRITYGKPTNHFKGNLEKLDDLELVRLQSHRNDWFVRQARQILQERAAAGKDMTQANAELREMHSNAKDVTRKLRALWALYGANGAGADWLRQQLGASDEHLRVWAIRLLVDQQAPSPDVLLDFAKMAQSDPSGLVLTYLASALQRISTEKRWPLAMALAGRGDFEQDKTLPLLVWQGIEASAGAAPERAVELVTKSRMPKVAMFAARRVFEDLEENTTAANALVEHLGKKVQPEALEGIAAALEGKRDVNAPASWRVVRSGLVTTPDRRARSLAQEIDARFGNAESQNALLEIVLNARQEPAARRRSLDVLVETRFGPLAAALPGLVADREIGAAAIPAMAALDSPDTAQVLLAKFASLPANARRQVVHAMASRPNLAKALLEAVQRGRIARTEIDASAQRQLRDLRDPELREKVFGIWPQSNASTNAKGEQFARYRKLLVEERLSGADLARGRAIYQQACGVCHKLYGEGAEIGPELTGADRHNLDYLLENIVSPSGIVPESYRAVTVTLKDDRVLNGIVRGKTEESISLQTATEKVTVQRSEVEAIRESELSMMPDGLLDPLSEQDIADLFAFLMSKTPPAGAK